MFQTRSKSLYAFLSKNLKRYRGILNRKSGPGVGIGENIKYKKHSQSARAGAINCSKYIDRNSKKYVLIHTGHSCKIGNMRCPGTLKNQNPQFEEKK